MLIKQKKTFSRSDIGEKKCGSLQAAHSSIIRGYTDRRYFSKRYFREYPRNEGNYVSY